MRNLNFLDVTRNTVGDAGLAALGDALARGAFPRLATLYLYNNQIGSRGLAALVQSTEAGAADGGAAADADGAAGAPLARLEKLYVDNNQVGEDGLSAVTRAIDAGRLGSLRSLHLSGNPIKQQLVDATLQKLEQRELQRGGAAAPPRPAPQTRDIESAPVG